MKYHATGKGARKGMKLTELRLLRYFRIYIMENGRISRVLLGKEARAVTRMKEPRLLGVLTRHLHTRHACMQRGAYAYKQPGIISYG